MLAGIVPAWVESAETFGDVGVPTLFPEEEVLLEAAVAKRRREFTTVRMCARAALARLGLPAAPILPGPAGEPIWPAGVVGSMTHCDKYRAAAVALTREALTVGIDAEPHAPLSAGVLDAIAVPEERPWLARLTAERPDVHWDRLLFTVKEAVYKAWFPLTNQFLDFEQVAVVDIGARSGVFVARLRTVAGVVVDGHGLTEFTGRWLVRRGVVASAIAVPR